MLLQHSTAIFNQAISFENLNIIFSLDCYDFCLLCWLLLFCFISEFFDKQKDEMKRIRELYFRLNNQVWIRLVFTRFVTKKKRIPSSLRYSLTYSLFRFSYNREEWITNELFRYEKKRNHCKFFDNTEKLCEEIVISGKQIKSIKQGEKTLKATNQNIEKFLQILFLFELHRKKSRAYFYLKCLCFFLINLECSSIGYQSSRFWWRWSDSISRHNNGDNTRQHISSRYKWIVKNLLSIVVMWCVVFV